ncbi:M23 family metallopeptidase [Paraflavitalea sp. CAU 1676]|uniref:M23 family metallopeptidase n=1 Tax=Paraflavitalea sp. CAU 1676 TaxID=3032598 RepID=UPI0023DB8EE1|nr:M23 family metallopeptidase [Paraflavitalea sp. CAU 1676]MDF2191009.1 M23 family metallopeptidase [Paraflavitalea sp. CAU 1676]
MKGISTKLNPITDGWLALLFLLIICFTQLSAIGQSGKGRLKGLDSLKGKLPLPVDRFCELDTYERRNGRLSSELNIACPPHYGLIFYSDSVMLLKASGPGKVLSVFEVDGTRAVFIQTEGYFFSYANLDTAFVKRGDLIQTAQPIGKITSTNSDGLYELEVWMSDLDKQIDPYPWFNFATAKRRLRQ